MRFNQDFIEKVREATNIVDIIGQHVQLRRAGPHRLTGLCPFHSEKTPSFSVSEDKQMYYCFGCKAAGNAYVFVQNIQGLSFPEAVEYLAERAGITIPKDAQATPDSMRQQDARKEREKLLYRINQFAAQFFVAVRKNESPSSEVTQYLKTRRLSPEIIEEFQIGYAQDEWEGLVSAFQKKLVPLDSAESLGLIRKRGEGKQGHYDVFRHRLIFPIVLPTGNVIGFGGRVLGDGQPKYLNSPESEIFHKGKVFYGLNASAKHIRAEDRAVVVEGYMDFLALYQAGIKPAVATLGTALTSDHARLLKRHTRNIIILFDGDEAGQAAAERSLPLLLQEGLIPRGLTLPNEFDPDDYIQENGVEGLEKLLKSAPELFMVVLEKHMAGYRASSAEKLAIVEKMRPHLQACEDKNLRDLYVREIAERLDEEVAWVAKASAHEPIQKSRVSSQDEPSKSPLSRGVLNEAKPENSQPMGETERIKVLKPPRAELMLLNVALMKVKYFQTVIDSGILSDLRHEGISKVFARLQQLYGQMPSKFDSLTGLLVAEVEPPEMVSLHLQTPLVELTDEGAEKLLTDCIVRIREARLKAQTLQMRAHMRGQDRDQQLEKLEQIMNIHRERNALNKDS